ncbi:molybdopterin-guanine dinucleotide biosynthesis protein B [Loigolactobacillus zhaoyuanensis]|uniref:molybdopterin-guanine dinucleotide biosynthesis protein B n=1 Tax=Loigolactobacillus zhaoyuanensis TaxID=2486017 RepID=UPI000F73967D|nr:molybdopterin-guanine dinucleotide biosynthesis protein B [Loigolactobacillus zhaoyuanensis]
MVAPLQVVGFKKSGKTTTINDFLTILKQLNVPVCVLKHDAHRAQMDQPGTDTATFATSGAQTVLLATNQAVMVRQQVPQLPNAAQLIATYAKPEQFCLLEGFKTAAYPKLVLVHSGERPSNFAKLTQVVAYASLTPPEFSGCLDFSTAALRQAWFTAYLQKAGI